MCRWYPVVGCLSCERMQRRCVARNTLDVAELVGVWIWQDTIVFLSTEEYKAPLWNQYKVETHTASLHCTHLCDLYLNSRVFDRFWENSSKRTVPQPQPWPNETTMPSLELHVCVYNDHTTHSIIALNVQGLCFFISICSMPLILSNSILAPFSRYPHMHRQPIFNSQQETTAYREAEKSHIAGQEKTISMWLLWSMYIAGTHTRHSRSFKTRARMTRRFSWPYGQLVRKRCLKALNTCGQ